MVLDNDLIPVASDVFPVEGSDSPTCEGCTILIYPLRLTVAPMSIVVFGGEIGYLCCRCTQVAQRARKQGYSNRAALLVAKLGLSSTTRDDIRALDRRVKEGELEEVILT